MISFKRGCHFKILLLVSSTLLLGCGEESFSDLEAYVKRVKAKQQKQIEPLPEKTMIEPFMFNLDGSRNPFKPVDKPEEEDPIIESNDDINGVKPDFTRSKEDLEAYPLDSLEMVGTVKSESSGLWALIRSQDGIQKVKVGNYMGLNHGKIIQVTEKQIDLIEIIKDKKPNVWFKQEASLRLKTAEEATE